MHLHKKSIKYPLSRYFLNKLIKNCLNFNFFIYRLKNLLNSALISFKMNSVHLFSLQLIFSDFKFYIRIFSRYFHFKIYIFNFIQILKLNIYFSFFFFIKLFNNFSNFHFYKKYKKYFKFFNKQQYIFSFFSFIFIKLFSLFLNKKIYIFINKNPLQNFSLFDITYIKTYLSTFFLTNLIFNEIFHIKTFFFLIYFAFKWVDFSWFFPYLQIILLKLNIFKHKLFFSFLFNFFYSHFYFILSKLKLVGFFFNLKGKLGVAGNSRKRRLFLNFGFTAHFNFKYKVYYKQVVLKTITGSVGCSVWLFYV